MAYEFLGSYYFPYDNGNKKFVFAFFSRLSTDSDTYSIPATTILQSSILANTESSSEWYKMDETQIDGTFSFHPLYNTKNQAYRIYKNGSSIEVFTPIKNSNGCFLMCMAKDENDDYYRATFDLVPNNTTLYEFDASNPSNDTAGFVVAQFVSVTNNLVFTKFTDTDWISYLNGNIDVWQPSTDPYADGGFSTANGGAGGGGGTGDFDNTSDTISLPSLPSLSGLNTGFFTAFIPSASQMQNVSHYLWNNAIDDILDVSTTFGENWTP